MKVIVHSRKLFIWLRDFDTISQEDIINSLKDSLTDSILKSTQESMGKSGSLFLFTPDRRYILKSLTQGELNTLTRRFLHNFCHYLTEGYIDSLIA